MTADLLALLDRLETVHAAATPPPWRADLDRTGGYDLVDEDGQYITDRLGALDEDNAAAIVAEHNALPGLVAAVRGALALADELEADSRDAMRISADGRERGDREVQRINARHGRVAHHAASALRTALASALLDTTKD